MIQALCGIDMTGSSDLIAIPWDYLSVTHRMHTGLEGPFHAEILQLNRRRWTLERVLRVMSYSNYTETLEGRGILLKVQQASQQLPCLVGAGIWAAAVPHGAVIT